MKIYCSNTKQDGIGGGWTFLRNLQKGLKDRVHFVSDWRDCDIFFIMSVTTTNKEELYEAHKAGKKIILRVDNVPRKSRNRRSSPHERLKEFAELSDVVIYQSQWAKDYCYPLCGDGPIIYNGVDQSVFKPNRDLQDPNAYLFAYHGKNEHKGFWNAHYIFQMVFREKPQAIFRFIYDFGKELPELKDAGFDFWNGERYEHLEKITDPQDMVTLLQCSKYLIYPAICDAAPNMVLEARACGCEVIGVPDRSLSGVQEMIELEDISLERMCDEYYGVFEVSLL